ncbi:hypothetical protein [Paraburkholderia antibiotica]|uniref:Uncharacterized protein n=1 Tax=Paraburkholderia antibiotica TaxID=2728839 RepID=A0A7X9ZUR6_9BURK|nr:hypothetical protein [Paraburkholderia antibiotica]NML29394.1 hypothetical protein [Paraburkholderia antibiotica]
MSTHLSKYSDTERYALDVLTRLHQGMRELAGTGGRLRVGSADEMRSYCMTVMHSIEVVRANDSLLLAFGRQRTTALSLSGPANVPGYVSVPEVLKFCRDDAQLRAAGMYALGEITANVIGLLADCEDVQPASGPRTLN